MNHTYKTYDHRLKILFRQSKNPDLFSDLNIPKSTIRTWIKKPLSNIVTHPSLDKLENELVAENSSLRKRLLENNTLSTLTLYTFRLFGFQIQFRKLKDLETKRTLISKIKESMKTIPLNEILDTLSLSLQRFKFWSKEATDCKLEEKTCQKLRPTKITSTEVKEIVSIASDKKYSHFSLTSLFLYAKRQDWINLSIASWFRVIKSNNVQRDSKRKYKLKHRKGIRASKPNQIWHLDLSIIKTIDGQRIYIQAIIDNFSRMILAHHVSTCYGGKSTVSLIKLAFENSQNAKPQIITDGGSENDNHQVHEYLQTTNGKLTIAGIDIDFSNSMIESFFHRLKNRYLYYLNLKDLKSVKKYVDFFVEEQNNKIPMLRLGGLTPFEAFSGEDPSEINIKVDIQKMREQRMIQNAKIAACSICPC